MQKAHVIAILAVGMTVVVVSVLAASLLAASQRIPNSGIVQAIGVGVYSNSDCTSNVTNIYWGFLDPGETLIKTVYIKNEGTLPLVLSLTTGNWSSSAAHDNIALNWNLEGYVLNTTIPVVQATLTLSVSAGISGVTNFGFDMIITGTEYP